jgi:hypothetical protein
MCDNFGSIQIFYTIRLADHRTKPGTAIQCKSKDSNCHWQSSVRVLRGIRAALSSVFCVVFCRPLFIIFSLFAWPLHCLPVVFMTSDNPFLNFSYLLTYTRTTMLSQLSNLFYCNIYANIYWTLQLFGIMNFLMIKD